MFFNASAFFQALWLLVVCALLSISVIVAHCVWVKRLAGLPSLSRRSRVERGLLMTAASITPVASFYVVEIFTWWKGRRDEALTPCLRALIISAGLTMAIAVINAARLEMHHAAAYRSWAHAVETCVGQFSFLAVAQIALLMIARVHARDWQKAYRWLVAAFAVAIAPSLI